MSIADTLKKAHTIVIDAEEGAMNEERCHFHLEHLAVKLDEILPYIKNHLFGMKILKISLTNMFHMS